MANRKNNISDKEVENAAGGRIKYYEDVKEWGIIDDDSPDDRIPFAWRKDKKDAEEVDKWYHGGKRIGYEKGYDEGFDAGLLKGATGGAE